MTNLADNILMITLFATGIPGLLLNGTILALSALKPELRVDYCWFLMGIAFVNCVYCLNTGTIDTFALLTNLDSNSKLCTFSGIILAWAGYSSVFTQPFLALNRYSSIFHREGHSKRFSRKNTILMLSFLYSSTFGVGMVFYTLQDYGKLGDFLCCIDYPNIPLTHLILLLFVPVGVSYSITVVCGVKIVRYISKYETQTRQRDLRSVIRETKQLVKLMFIEVVLPISLESPVLVVIIVMKFTTVPDMVLSLALCLFVIHPVTDPIIIILVMKPYRSAVINIWRKRRNGNLIEPTKISNQQSQF